MHIFKLVSFTFLSTAAALVIDGQSGAPNGDIYKRQGGDPDFSGTGNIFVVPGKNIQTANPNHRVGCITAQGGFVSGTSNCGVFTVQTGQPFRSTAGTCSFSDPTAPVGRPQAPQGYAFKCSSSTPAGSAFYSLNLANDPGAGLAWVWTGNLNPYYEALSVPAVGQTVSMWYYAGGIDPPTDRVYFTWLWVKLS